MLENFKKRCISLLYTMPDFAWNVAERVLKKRLPADYFETLRLERFGKYLLKHFDQVWQQAAQNKKCMVIEKGQWLSTYFNIAVANNMMALSIYALYHGCIPVIRLNEDKDGCFKWDWYFRHFHDVMGTDITDFEEIPCDVTHTEFVPNLYLVNEPKGWRFRLFQMLFRRLIQLNEEMRIYVENEIATIGDPAQMLGVVLRGTDYVKLKPAGHPIQPEPEEIASKTLEVFKSGKFSAVYVATEEKKLYNLIGNAVGDDNVRENKRQYYDELFYGQNTELIGKVHFDRKDDNYWKGVEYLSSLMILSRCRSIVAGGCGATLFAMLLGDYLQPTIFDRGVY